MTLVLLTTPQFDGNKLGWSTLQIKKLNVTVDLNVEEGRKPSDKNKFRVLVNPTRVVSFSHLYTYMQGQTDYDNSDANAVSLLDHLLREGPSGKYTQIKRNFFARGSARFSLGQGVEAFKGVYASMRPVLNAQRLPGFSVNIDVGKYSSSNQVLITHLLTQDASEWYIPDRHGFD